MEKEYIERETILNLLKNYGIKRGNKVYGIADIGDVIMAIENIPTIDAVLVIRCKDCKKWEEDGSYEFDADGTKRLWGACSNSLHHCKDNHFCSYGERRGNNE